MKTLCLLLLLTFTLHAADRVALVIGNDAYQHANPLDTAVNDATAVAAALQKLGFETLTASNAGLETMIEAMDKLRSKAAGARAVLVYYAGHGIESNGTNYLVPVDAKLDRELQLRTQALSMDSVLEDLKRINVPARMIILDCCRDNPLEGRSWLATRGAGRGLAALPQDALAEATLVVYSASPGKPALDRVADGDAHSPFTTALLEQMSKPKVHSFEMFGLVEDAVIRRTDGRQAPRLFYNGSTQPFRNFQFDGGPDNAAGMASQAQVIAPPAETTAKPAQPPAMPVPQKTGPPPKPRPIPTSGIALEAEKEREDQLSKQNSDKMDKIRFPMVTFRGATIEEAIEYLRIKSRDLDTFTEPGGFKGVNLILRTGDSPSNASLNLDLKDVPMSEALRYVTELANMKYRVTPYAVMIVPLSESSASLTTRVYPFNDELVEDAKDSFLSIGDPFAAPADPFAANPRPSFRSFTPAGWLAANGIVIPEGGSATINERNQTLLVRTTDVNHELVGEIIRQMYRKFKDLERPVMSEETLGKDWYK